MAAGCTHSYHYHSCPDLALIVKALPGVGRPLVEGGPITNKSSQSAVSWAAIFSGALAAVSITLVLLALVSPWPNSGASATTFTIGAGIGLIVVQWLAADIGGFLTGRLRTKWVSVHVHEIFLPRYGARLSGMGARDGHRHLAVRLGRIVDHRRRGSCRGNSRGRRCAGCRANGGASGFRRFFLWRGQPVSFGPSGPGSQSAKHECAGNAYSCLRHRQWRHAAADRTYVAQLVAARTGISQADAEKRVDEVIAREKAAEVKVKQAADAARLSPAPPRRMAAACATSIRMAIKRPLPRQRGRPSHSVWRKSDG